MRTLIASLIPILCLLPVSQSIAAEVGQPAPAFSLPLMNAGTHVSLDSYRGTIVYLDFWASWCPPCRLSMPLMNTLRNRYRQRGLAFEVLAVNVDSNPADGLDFLLDEPVDYPVLGDPAGSLPALYGVKGMPTAYLIDGEGVIRLVHEGFRRGDDAVIEAEVQRLLEALE